MNLHNDSEKFGEFIQFTAEYLEMPEVYIEKDYWVTFMLYNLYHGKINYMDEERPLKDYLVFKGGTSLSKGFKYIDRFSEDVDLVILKKSFRLESDNKKIMERAQKVIAPSPLVQNKLHSDSKDSRLYKKKIFNYDIIDPEADFLHSLPYIILELNFFSEPTPLKEIKLSSYIHDFLNEHDGQEDIKTYKLEPFELNLLCTTRTFLEKVLALYRGAHRSKEELMKRIRHFYDIYMLLTKDAEVIALYSNQEEFKRRIQHVIGEEIYHEAFNDIEEFLPLCESCLSVNIEEYKDELKEQYDTSFSTMVYKRDSMPSFEEVYGKIFEIIGFLIKEKI